METAHFRLHFEDSYLTQAKQLATIAEQVYPLVTDLLDWQPKEKTELSLFDYVDETFGIANVTPYSVSSIFLTPPIEGELKTDGDWLRLIFSHEFTHIVHLDKRRSLPLSLQSIFGRHPFIFTNRFQPPWFTEGLATYIESQLNKGAGRLNSPAYEAFMRNEVAHGLKPLSQINVSGVFWPLNHSYLYGSYFFAFLEQSYGPDAIRKLIHEYSDNIIPYRIISNPKIVTGFTLPVLWEQYYVWLENRFRPQIDALQVQAQQLQHKPSALTTTGYLNSSPVQNLRGELFYVEYTGKAHSRIIKLDKELRRHELAQVQPNASLDIHPISGLLVAQPATCNRRTIYGDLYVIPNRAINRPDSTTIKRITRCSRYRRASWSNDGKYIAAVKHFKGRYSIDLLNSKGDFQKTLYESHPGELLGSIDWSPTAAKLLLNRKLDSNWMLYSFDIESTQWTLLNNKSTSHARYAENGKQVIYTSHSDGILQIELLDIKSRQKTQLTTAIGGASQPSGYSKDGLLAYVSIDQDGNNIFRPAPNNITANGLAVVDQSNTIIGDSQQQHNSKVERLNSNDFNSKDFNSKDDPLVHDYMPLKTSRPRFWEPAWQMEDDANSYGAKIEGHDALNFHHYLFKLLYESDLKEYSGDLFYSFDRNLFLSANRDLDVEGFDKAGNIVYKTDTQYQLMYAFPFTTLRKMLQVGLGYNFERLKYETTNETIFAKNENIVGIHLLYSTTRKFPLNFSTRTGRSVEFVFETYQWLNKQVEGEINFAGEVYLLDWHEYIPLAKTTLALRYVQGWATDSPTLFELGGSFSESDNTLPRINQRDFSLRGYDSNSPLLQGRRMRLATAELRVPLARVFATMMAPPLGLRRVSGNLFVESGGAWHGGGSPDRYHSAAGIELLGEIVFGYNLQLDTRIGFAKGFSDIGEEKTYIGLGRAF